jgi:Dual specificity phosphatase, catalytic domain
MTTPSRRQAEVPPTSASEVSPGVFVGGWKEAAIFSGTKICVREDPPEGMTRVTHIPVFDELREMPIPANLDRVSELLRAAHDRNETVLVFCGHGVRRSPLAVAWYLQRTEGITLDQAYAQIARARPGIERVQDWARGWAAPDDSAPDRK